MKLTLETERLTLRVLFEDHAPLTTHFYQRNWDFLSCFEPNISARFCDMAFQRNCLHYEFQKLKEGHFIRYWYSPKTEPDTLYGSICFQHITGHPFGSCQIGYKQDREQMGQGFATEAATAAISHLFRDCSLHRVEALVETSNSSSIHLLERIGFEQEGIARESVFLRNEWQDCYRYAIINK